jgi:hypothetical protein
MNPRVFLSGLDSAFLSLETPSTPMNVMGTFVLNASGASSGYSYKRVHHLVQERAPGLARGEGALPDPAPVSAREN